MKLIKQLIPALIIAKYSFGQTIRLCSLKKPLCLIVVFSLFIPSVIPLLADEQIKQDQILIKDQEEKIINNSDISKIENITQDAVSLDQKQNIDQLDVVVKKDFTGKFDVSVKDENNIQPDLQNRSPISQPSTSNIPNLTSPQTTAIRPEVDQTTGALTYNYPFEFPNGVHNVTPQVSLIYNSQNTKNDSIVGYGWSLSIPYIERENKHGTDQIFVDSGGSAQYDFVSSIDGELTAVDLTHFAPKSNDGSFHQYSFVSNVFSLTDKNGTTYTYGANSSSQQDDPNTPNRIYKWMISSIVDIYGNTITFTYFKDQGQIYPDTINYTGTTTSNGIFTITFNRISQNTAITEYTNNFAKKTAFKISDMTISVNGVNRKKYQFNYTVGDNNIRTMLQSVSVVDMTGSVIPSTTTFSYTTNRATPTSSLGFGLSQSIDSNIKLDGCSIGSRSSMNCGGQFADLNADGLPDYVAAAADLNSGSTATYNYSERDVVYLNNGDGTFTNANWTFPTRTIYNTNINLIGTTATHVSFYDSWYASTSWSSYNSLQLVDINNDGRADLIWQDRTSSNSSNPMCGNWGNNQWKVYINTGSGWSYDPTWYTPTTVCDIGLISSISQFVDINGDGYLDVYASVYNTYYNGLQQRIFLNNHINGWDGAYSVNTNGVTIEWPAVSTSATTENGFSRITDINNDGLPDLIISIRMDHKGNGTGLPNIINGYINIGEWQYVFINTGGDFKYDPTYPLFPQNNLPFFLSRLTYPTIHPSHIVFTEFDEYNASNQNRYKNNLNNIFDITGDGQVDLIDGTNVYLSQNNLNWTQDTFYSSILNSNTTPQVTSTMFPAVVPPLVDMNGDGMLDSYADPATTTVRYNQNKPTDLLSSIVLPTGGILSATYKSSAQYRDTSGILLNPQLPVVIQTVNSITETNPSNPSSQATIQYEYAGGSYYYGSPYDHRFAGFEKVIAMFPDGTKKITYYHQGNTTNGTTYEYDDYVSKIGKVYRVDTLDPNGAILTQTTTKYEKIPLASVALDRYFVYPSQTITTTFSGVQKSTAVTNSFDVTTGNLLNTTNWGEVIVLSPITFTDSGADKKTKTIIYATNGLGLYVPAQETNTDQLGSIFSDTRHYYDGLPLGQVLLGSETRTENLKSNTTYIAMTASYDSYGNQISYTDPLNYTTNYIYDLYHIYPISFTNSLSHITSYIYDYLIDKPLSVTENTGTTSERKTLYTYDTLGRILSIQIPDPNSTGMTPAFVTVQTMSYVDTPNSISTTETDFLSSAVSIQSFAYFDSFGRTIQTRRSTESTSQFTVSDTSYDNMGRISTTSLPYFSTGISYTSPINSLQLISSTLYDYFGRPVVIQNSLGITTMSYSGWMTTVTDTMGHSKDMIVDADNNLVQVHEHNGMVTYTTNYLYDANNNLLKITDALGNVRNFTYDLLGHRLTAEDLHASTDIYFGTWNYVYDDDSNMIQSTSPNIRIINYTYDTLNRPLTEDYTGASGIEVTYVYDTCTKGIGKLCTITKPSGGNSAYVYDINGRVKTESVTSGVLFTTSYTYDYAGNPLTITYPDLSVVRYTYDTGGHISRIEQKENGGSFVNILSFVTYAENGRSLILTFANGTTTTNTYDASHMYRLINKTTTNMAGAQLQNLSYTYDTIGNILQTADISATSTAKNCSYTYDDLSRLLSANCTAHGNTLYTESYTYNALGNILIKTTTVGNTPTTTTTYTYLGTGTSSAYKYANPHAQTSTTTTTAGVAGSTTITYTYDKDGNIINDGMDVMTWNYKDEMATSRLLPGTLNIYYYYDYTGNRVKKNVGGICTYYPNRYFDQTGTGTTAKKEKYIYLGSTLIATFEKNGANPLTKHFVTSDQVSSSSTTSDASGILEETIDYYPYGDKRIDTTTSSFNEPKKFGGHYADGESIYTYFGARYYNPKTGRFLSEDPMFWNLPKEYLLDPQQWNSYSYARDNPMSKGDSDGRMLTDYVPGIPNQGIFFSEGKVEGVYYGIPIRSNGPNDTPGPYSPYQCTSFVKDFVKNRFGVNVSGNGVDYGSQSNYDSAMKNQKGSFTVYKNGGTELPKENDIMSWKSTDGGPYGHTGIVVQVDFNKKTGTGTLWTAEQNQSARSGLFHQDISSKLINGTTHYSIQPKSLNSPNIPNAFARYNSTQQNVTNNFSGGIFSRIKSFFKK